MSGTAKVDLEEKLIELVRIRPYLYEKTDPDYKHKEKKNNAWAAIGLEIGLSGPESSALWVSVRGQYVAFIRKLNNPTGSAANRRPYFRHENQMDFYKDKATQTLKSVTNFNTTADDSTENDENEEPSTASDSQEPTPNALEMSTQPKPKTYAPPSKKKKMPEFEQKLIEILQETSNTGNTDDECDAFAKSLAPKLRRILYSSKAASSEIQYKILKLIYEKELELEIMNPDD